MSQNPDTKNYIIVYQDNYFCINCNKKYTEIYDRWCESCQINDLKHNWTSGNEKINNFIQEMQLKINDSSNKIFEWIPYNQLDNIEEINKGDLATIYSAIWNNGPLNYDEYIRKPNKKVALKCIHNSQNITAEFLNEV